MISRKAKKVYITFRILQTESKRGSDPGTDTRVPTGHGCERDATGENRSSLSITDVASKRIDFKR